MVSLTMYTSVTISAAVMVTSHPTRGTTAKSGTVLDFRSKTMPVKEEGSFFVFKFKGCSKASDLSTLFER